MQDSWGPVGRWGWRDSPPSLVGKGGWGVRPDSPGRVGGLSPILPGVGGSTSRIAKYPKAGASYDAHTHPSGSSQSRYLAENPRDVGTAWCAAALPPDIARVARSGCGHCMWTNRRLGDHKRPERHGAGAGRRPGAEAVSQPTHSLTDSRGGIISSGSQRCRIAVTTASVRSTAPSFRKIDVRRFFTVWSESPRRSPT